MASELKRGTIRMSANYARLASTLIIGIAFLPVMLVGLGHEGYGLIALLGSTMGLAEMCRGIVRACMKRELGTVYHSGNSDAFQDAYNSAALISGTLALITIVLFTIVYSILPILKVPVELFHAAQWLVIAKGLYSTLIVLLGPAFNMYQISERMILYNLWIVLDRATDFIAAVILFVLLGMRDPAEGIVAYAWLSSGTGIAVLLFAVGLIMVLDRRMVPDFSRISMAEVRKMLPTMGWNTAVVTIGGLHIRLAQFIMNLFFGVVGNSMFGIGVRFSSYVRIAAFGSTDGVEVVSARLSSQESRMTVPQLVGYTTRLQASIAVPAALVVLILAGPIINVWIGWIPRAVEDPSVIPAAVLIAKVLVLGMMLRGIADAWKRILYGAGHVRAYGPAVIIGGILNPLLAIALILFLPGSSRYQGAAWAFSLTGFLVNFVWVPRIAAQCLNMRAIDIIGPVARPAIAAGIASAALWLPYLLDREDSIVALFLSLALFATIHASMCWLYVLAPAERERLIGVLARRLGMNRRVAAGL